MLARPRLALRATRPASRPPASPLRICADERLVVASSRGCGSRGCTAPTASGRGSASRAPRRRSRGRGRTRARSRTSARSPAPRACSTCAFSTCRGEARPASRRATATSQSTSAVASSHGIRRSVARSGCELEVAVAALPARHRVAGHRVHLHVEREQVVAALDPVAGVDSSRKNSASSALAHQAALHVGEGADDGVDRAGLDVGPQLVQRQHDADFNPLDAARITCGAPLARPSTQARAAGGRDHEPQLQGARSTPTRTCFGSAARTPTCSGSTAARSTRRP